MRFAIFALHLSQVLRLPRKSDARSYEVLHLSHKIILANLTLWCSQVRPLPPKQRPDLLTSLMGMSLVLRLPREMQILLKCPTPAHVFELLQSLHVFEHFWECAQSRAPATQDDILTSKHECSVPVSFLHFWLRNVHRATTACTFCTFQLPSAPNLVCLVCFVHDVDLEICFAPQRHALFQHLNFQKCTEAGVFCPLWLGNMLRATTACAFSTSQHPKVRRSWCALHVLTWKYASRHNGLRFFNISTSKSAPNLVSYTFWLRNVLRARTACNFRSLIWPDGSAPAALASLLFDPPEPQIIRKTQCFPTFLPFPAPASSVFWLFLLSDLLSSSLLFSSLTLPTSAFSSVHIVGSLTSKLPSLMLSTT